MSEKALTPVEQKSVRFYEDEIIAVRLTDGRIIVPLRPIVESLGMNWSGQAQRIERDPVLSEIKGVCVIHTPSSGQRGGGPQEMLCLPLEYLNGWLFGINANRVKEDLRERVIRYQKESYRVLHEAFQEGRLTTSGPHFEELLEQDTETVQAYKMALAIVKLARQQIMLDGRVGDSELRLDNVEERLSAVEEQLTGQEVITADQASQISQAVKTVAIAYGKTTGQNQFGAVYGEMYRKFGVTSYKLLPAKKFKTCMAWLTDWHQSLTSELPF